MATKKKIVKEDVSTQTKDEKITALLDAINGALKQDGKVYTGRDFEVVVDRIPTGILSFDIITGGGVPRKKLTELFGKESSGKTTLAHRAVAAAQQNGGIAGWVVGEEYDDDWAEEQGVDLKRIIKFEAVAGDLALEASATAVESGLLDLLVIDSYQALGTDQELNNGVDSESFAAAGAGQMWGRYYRRILSAFNSRKANTAIIGVSQVRDAIGVFSPKGKPEPKPTGIHALRHWASISVSCRAGEPIFADINTDKRRIVKKEFHLHCKKNKTAPPERSSSFWYNFDEHGVDTVDEIIRWGKVYELLHQGGRVLEGYGIKVSGSKESPAEEQFREALRQSPNTVKELRTDILSAAWKKVVK